MTRRALRIGLVQINRGLNLTRQRFEGRKARGWGVAPAPAAAPASSSEWLLFPYSVGLLQAYATRHAADPTRFQFRTPIVRPMPPDEAVDLLRGVDVAGFSTYVWNIELSLEIARRLKTASPETQIVFGGPQVPNDAGAFLRMYPQVDLTVHGEGERTFLGILEALESRDWSSLDGVSYRADERADERADGRVDGRRDGQVIRRAAAPRLQNLETIPSPYLSGVFDELITRHPTGQWILMWETNRGCPFACTFCDWGSAIASKVYQFDIDRLRAELDWFGAMKGELIFCCDANFGILPRDIDIVDYAAGVKGRTGGFPRALAVQNTKNSTERSYQVQKRLSEAGMNAGVTISLQSTDSGTLDAVRRANISLQSFHELQRRYVRDGVETYTDMILALPGETYDSYANGIADVIARGQHNRIQFYNCSILPNAEMADPAYRAQWGLVTVRQRIADTHRAIGEVDPGGVPEYIETVVATSTMPAEDWVRAKAFWWMTELLHYDRLMQITFIVLHAATGLSYRRLVEAFAGADPSRFPTVASVQALLVDHARSVQAGGEEYLPSPEVLGITWPADQYAFVRLVSSWQIDAFYDEATILLGELVDTPGPIPHDVADDISHDVSNSVSNERADAPSHRFLNVIPNGDPGGQPGGNPGGVAASRANPVSDSPVNERQSTRIDRSLLTEVVAFNRALLRLPFEIDDLSIDLSWNFWAFYRGVLTGSPIALVREAERHEIARRKPMWLSWEDWYEHVVFCQNQKSGYLYPTRTVLAEVVA